LPAIPPLRNMVGNVNHDNASEAGHSQKISERTRTWQDSGQFLDRGNRLHSHIGRKKWGQSRLSPVFPPSPVSLVTLGGKNGDSPVCPRFFPSRFFPSPVFPPSSSSVPGFSRRFDLLEAPKASIQL
jgi:hypothetical protein